MGIVGTSFVRSDQRDRLAPQGFAYTALERGPKGEAARIVDVIDDALVARESPQALLAHMADPKIRIISLTVTEKGYCHDPATGRLNRSHPDILHDLVHPETPKSAPGLTSRPWHGGARRALCDRDTHAKPAIRHRAWQIAMDRSQVRSSHYLWQPLTDDGHGFDRYTNGPIWVGYLAAELATPVRNRA